VSDEMKVGSLVTTADLSARGISKLTAYSGDGDLHAHREMGIIKEIFESEREVDADGYPRRLMRIHWLVPQVLPEVMPMDLGFVVEVK